jgi:hypothetical protein
MGEFQPKGPEINPVEIAKQYAEKIRQRLADFKENGMDRHFEGINPNELTMEDLMAVDKLTKGELDEKSEAFKRYHDDVSTYLRKYAEEFKKDARDPNFNTSKINDSRENLRAWIINKLVDRKLEQKHPERPRQELFAHPKKS